MSSRSNTRPLVTSSSRMCARRAPVLVDIISCPFFFGLYVPGVGAQPCCQLLQPCVRAFLQQAPALYCVVQRGLVRRRVGCLCVVAYVLHFCCLLRRPGNGLRLN